MRLALGTEHGRSEQQLLLVRCSRCWLDEVDEICTHRHRVARHCGQLRVRHDDGGCQHTDESDSDSLFIRMGPRRFTIRTQSQQPHSSH